MHNRYDWCECDRVAGIDDIKKGICKIEEGIKDIRCGLKKLCKCQVREGIKYIQKGLCKLEKGLCCVVKGLEDYDGCSEGKHKIKEGICDIKEGIKCIGMGLCDVCKCDVCKGVASIQAGLECVEKGLCNLVEGLKDILNDMDIKRKHRCDVMDEYDCGRDHMYDDRMDCGGWGDMRYYDNRMSPGYQKPDCCKW